MQRLEELRAGAKEHSAFTQVMILWGVLSLGACLAGPWVMAAIWDVEPHLPLGSRVSLIAAALTLSLALFCLMNVWRLAAGRPTAGFSIPRSLLPWLAGLVPVAVGLLIGMTVFR